jgi:hypothetical protein
MYLKVLLNTAVSVATTGDAFAVRVYLVPRKLSIAIDVSGRKTFEQSLELLVGGICLPRLIVGVGRDYGLSCCT